MVRDDARLFHPREQAGVAGELTDASRSVRARLYTGKIMETGKSGVVLQAAGGRRYGLGRRRSQRGASAIEYVIIAAVIALAIWAAASSESFQDAFSNFFDEIEEAISVDE